MTTFSRIYISLSCFFSPFSFWQRRSHQELHVRQTLLPHVIPGRQERCPLRRRHVSYCTTLIDWFLCVFPYFACFYPGVLVHSERDRSETTEREQQRAVVGPRKRDGCVSCAPFRDPVSKDKSRPTGQRRPFIGVFSILSRCLNSTTRPGSWREESFWGWVDRQPQRDRIGFSDYLKGFYKYKQPNSWALKSFFFPPPFFFFFCYFFLLPFWPSLRVWIRFRAAILLCSFLTGDVRATCGSVQVDTFFRRAFLPTCLVLFRLPGVFLFLVDGRLLSRTCEWEC